MKLLATNKIIGNEASSVEYLASRFTQKSDEQLNQTCQVLALKLQQTLDVETLLQTFCEHASRIVPCSSVIYENNVHNVYVSLGTPQEHTCNYSLEIGHLTLGSIECSSPKPFSEKELFRLESTLSILVFPLRNSLQYKEALQLALIDPLTQIANRTAFDSSIDMEVARATRHETPFCMLVLDIDHFKLINDTHGHLSGDEVLKNVAKRLLETIRAEDSVFRYGGEEFVILLSGAELKNASEIAERIRAAIGNSPIKALEQNIGVTISIGISQWQNGESGNSLFHRADQALYKAKQLGRDQVRAA